MTRRLTAIVERYGDGYVAFCPEFDIASQGETVVEARDALAEAVALFLEAAPADEVDRRLRGEVYVTQIEVAVGETARPVRSRGPYQRRQNHGGVSRPMEKVAEAHRGGALSNRWTDIDPSKYDGAREVDGFKLEPGYFISPHHVPDGVRLLGPRQQSYLIQLRYLTDQEPIEFSETELSEIHFGLGRNSGRLVSVKVATNKGFPEWEKVESLISKLISQRDHINHFVARSVLREWWPQLAEQVRELQAA